MLLEKTVCGLKTGLSNIKRAKSNNLRLSNQPRLVMIPKPLVEKAFQRPERERQHGAVSIDLRIPKQTWVSGLASIWAIAIGERRLITEPKARQEVCITDDILIHLVI